MSPHDAPLSQGLFFTQTLPKKMWRILKDLKRHGHEFVLKKNVLLSDFNGDHPLLCLP